MSTITTIGSLILTWVVLAVLTALVLGETIRMRDGHHPAEHRSSDTGRTLEIPASDATQRSSTS